MGSGRKNVLNAFPLVSGGDLSANLTSDPVDMQYMDNAGISVAWTGTPTGTISIQGSLDYKPTDPPRAGNWFDLTFDPALSQPAGSSGSILVNVNQLPYPWLRVNYVSASGSGNVDIWVCGKML